MRGWISRSICCAVILWGGLLLRPDSAGAQGRAAVPDFTGFWINQYTPDLSRALGQPPPFTSVGAERWRTVDTSQDPTGRCLPPGPSRALTAPYPFQIAQHPTPIAIMFEYFGIWITSTSR